MIIGSIICCISVIIMTIISAITGLADTISIIHNVEKSQSAAAQGAATGADSKDAIVFLVMMYVFIASFACTWGPIGWIYPTELYSQGKRLCTYIYILLSIHLFNRCSSSGTGYHHRCQLAV